MRDEVRKRGRKSTRRSEGRNTRLFKSRRQTIRAITRRRQSYTTHQQYAAPLPLRKPARRTMSREFTSLTRACYCRLDSPMRVTSRDNHRNTDNENTTDDDDDNNGRREAPRRSSVARERRLNVSNSSRDSQSFKARLKFGDRDFERRGKRSLSRSKSLSSGLRAKGQRLIAVYTESYLEC